MIDFSPSFSTYVQGGRLDSFAFVPPTLSPRPFPPRRAGKGANSHIWPTLLRQDVQRDGQRRTCWHTALAVLTAANSAHIQIIPETHQHLKCAHGKSAGTDSLQTHGHIRLLAPLSAPAGVERGGGDRGGKNQTVESQSRLGQAQRSRGDNT
jgi:hypothetical protein